jgi:hypothetical protein
MAASNGFDMISSRRNLMLIIVSLILSIAVHVFSIIAFSGFKGFQFPGLSSYNIMTINLQEGTVPNRLIKDKRLYLLKNYSEKNPVPENKDAILKNNQDENWTDRDQDKGTRPSEDNPRDKTSANSEKPAEETKYRDDSNKIETAKPVVKRTPLLIPRASNEIFDYDISWLGIHAGNAILEAVDNNGLFKITSRVRSSSFVSAFYKVEDYAESLVRDGIPVNFRIKQHEGKYVSNKETIFEADKGNITFFNYVKNIKDEHIIKDRVAWDVISGFYYLRTQPLEIGKAVYIDIFDSDKFYSTEVNVLRKEKIKIPYMGEVDTILVKPELKSDGLFQKKGDILIWLTNDERKIPVRVETKVPVGSVVAELRNFKIE